MHMKNPMHLAPVQTRGQQTNPGPYLIYGPRNSQGRQDVGGRQKQLSIAEHTIDLLDNVTARKFSLVGRVSFRREGWLPPAHQANFAVNRYRYNHSLRDSTVIVLKLTVYSPSLLSTHPQTRSLSRTLQSILVNIHTCSCRDTMYSSPLERWGSVFPIRNML